MLALVAPKHRPAPAAALIALATTLIVATAAQADDKPATGRKAPADYELFENDKLGAYFIPNAIKVKYESLRRRFAELRSEIDEARIEEPRARREIEKLQTEIDDAIRQIEKSRFFVPAAPIRTRTDSATFPLAPEDMLLVGDFTTGIDCDDVEIRGGEGPNVRCVVEKTVLSGESLEHGVVDARPPVDDFGEIKVVARRCSGREMFGGYKPSLDHPEAQGRIDAFPLKPFIDRDFTSVTLTGLTIGGGNQQVVMDARNEMGHGLVGATQRRHAKLTLFVPKCRGVGVWGGLEGLRVQSLDCPLMVWGMGVSHQSSRYEVVDLGGSLTADNIAIHRVKGVRGDVRIVATAHGRSLGASTPGLSYEDVQGDLTARFCRVDLSIAGITGRVDVANDFGRTTWRADQPIADVDHRIVSQSGPIDVRFSPDALGRLKLTLATECGGIQRRPLNAGRFTLQMVQGGLGQGDVVDRAWTGLVSGDREGPGFGQEGMFVMLPRLVAALSGASRAPGVDIVSRAGVVTYQPATD